MALQITTNINVDFYDNKYVMVNAKQYDDKSRLISITCYNQGDIYNISSKNHTAYIKYKKADGHCVLNCCTINIKGQILVELTEQMLAASGICYVDLLIVNKGSAKINIDTGDIITIDGSSILTTKAFYIDVQEAVVDNSFIESGDEYNGLTDLIYMAQADYSDVILSAKSYAIGTGNYARENDENDNAKYYSQLAKSYSQSVAESADKASKSAANAKNSEINAKTSEQNAKTSETNAEASKTSASVSALNARSYEESAINNAKIAISYAVGEGGVRDNESNDNARYYYEEIKRVVNGASSVVVPMGSITFSELANAEKASGYMYNVKDDFVTDNTFKEGSGMIYTAGTNVFYTEDGYWDCLGGSSSPVATVDEVKSYLGIE